MAATAFLAGCESLFLPPFDGAFPSGSPIAAYDKGSATIAIEGGETIELDHVAEGAGVDSLFGSNVRWTGPSGWHLRLNGAGGDGTFGQGDGYLTFDRIVDGEHWTTFDGSRCIVDVEVIDEDAVRGTATCKGVKWYDALDLNVSPTEPEPLDEPEFDAEVTFEATP